MFARGWATCRGQPVRRFAPSIHVDTRGGRRQQGLAAKLPVDQGQEQGSPLTTIIATISQQINPERSCTQHKHPAGDRFGIFVREPGLCASCNSVWLMRVTSRNPMIWKREICRMLHNVKLPNDCNFLPAKQC